MQKPCLAAFLHVQSNNLDHLRPCILYLGMQCHVLLRRELGFLGSLPALLRLRQANGNVARQKACNLLCALETVQLLVGARADTAATQSAKVHGLPVSTRDGSLIERL